MRVEKGKDLLLEEVVLEGAEELFGLGQSQPEMLDALSVLVQGNDIGDGLFVTFIVTDDELQFEAHRGLLWFERQCEGIVKWLYSSGHTETRATVTRERCVR